MDKCTEKQCYRNTPHPAHMWMLNRVAYQCTGIQLGGGTLYFCPTIGEIEPEQGGGFDVCCAHPELHVYLGYGNPGIDAISMWLSEKAKEEYANLARHQEPEPLADNVLEHVTRSIARVDLDRTVGTEQELPASDHPYWSVWRGLARNAITAYCSYMEHQGQHRYLSTGCLHGEHGYCQSNTGSQGQKIPAVCKFCEAPCVCSCHLPGETPVTATVSGQTKIDDIVTGSNDDMCAAEPPQRADDPDSLWGDCWCTKPKDHEGDHSCEICTTRHGAPTWPQKEAMDCGCISTIGHEEDS